MTPHWLYLLWFISPAYSTWQQIANPLCTNQRRPTLWPGGWVRQGHNQWTTHHSGDQANSHGSTCAFSLRNSNHSVFDWTVAPATFVAFSFFLFFFHFLFHFEWLRQVHADKYLHLHRQLVVNLSFAMQGVKQNQSDCRNMYIHAADSRMSSSVIYGMQVGALTFSWVKS